MKGDYEVTVDREGKMKVWKKNREKESGQLIRNERARNGRKIKNKETLKR